MKFDLQDCLLAAGFVSFETGVGFIYWPAALILAGLLCFAFALAIEREKKLMERAKKLESVR
jgi:hypothetical protein